MHDLVKIGDIHTVQICISKYFLDLTLFCVALLETR